MYDKKTPSTSYILNKYLKAKFNCMLVRLFSGLTIRGQNRKISQTLWIFWLHSWSKTINSSWHKPNVKIIDDFTFFILERCELFVSNIHSRIEYKQEHTIQARGSLLPPPHFTKKKFRKSHRGKLHIILLNFQCTLMLTADLELRKSLTMKLLFNIC